MPQAAREWQILRSATRERVMGFDVRLYEVAAVRSDVLKRLRSALSLIEEIDPRRFNRMRADLSHIVVKPTIGAFYWIISNTCALETPEILGRSTAILALTIVHEATHARLTHAGIYPSSVPSKRLERRCVREELSFTHRLTKAGYTGTDRLVAWLEARLTDKLDMAAAVP